MAVNQLKHCYACWAHMLIAQEIGSQRNRQADLPVIDNKLVFYLLWENQTGQRKMEKLVKEIKGWRKKKEILPLLSNDNPASCIWANLLRSTQLATQVSVPYADAHQSTMKQNGKKMPERFVQWHKFAVLKLYRVTLAFSPTICSPYN